MFRGMGPAEGKEAQVWGGQEGGVERGKAWRRRVEHGEEEYGKCRGVQKHRNTDVFEYERSCTC